MKHKDKVKLARRLRTQDEIRRSVSIWNSAQWEQRKEARRRKERRKVERAHQRREQEKQAIIAKHHDYVS